MSGIQDAQEHSFAVKLMEHLVVPTFVLNTQRQVIIWNRACERLTGIPAAEVLGTADHWRAFYEAPRHCLADLIALGQMNGIDQLYESHSGSTEPQHGLRAENWCVMPRLKQRLFLAIDAGPIFDEEGKLIAVVETLRDHTEQKLAQMALESLAIKDGLTGVANRRAFEDSLGAHWRHAIREQEPLSLLLIDVDHFKKYNDTLGHQAGDACLRQVAGALEEQTKRPHDLVARYGGEEFVIILPRTDGPGALQVAERIRAGVAALAIPHKASTTAPHVTVSIGLATMIPRKGETEETLVRHADQHLYAAKAAGRNQVYAGEAQG